MFGFQISGGLDQPIENQTGIIIKSIQPNAEAQGLKINDQILQIDGYDMTMVTFKQCLKRIEKNKTGSLKLVITREDFEQHLK